MSILQKTPIWFWIISIVAFLWNLMGVGAFLMDVNMSHEDMVTNYGQVLADAAAAQPSWVTIAYGLAVFGGALGCLLLLLRKKAAFWPLLVSLICVLLQQGYSRFATDIMEAIPTSNKVMYAMVVVIALFLVWFARKMTAKGILR